MSEPQISRRCPECGASFRERAFFCPQCGKSLGDQSSHSFIDTGSNTVIETGSNTMIDSGKTIIEEAPDTAPLETNDTLADVIHSSPNELPTPKQRPGGRAPAYGTSAKVRRVAAGARETYQEDLAPRVEKLRRISTVVLDEAAYDPSIRFLLVAAVLFIVFLTILVLSKLIG